ncbi:hypothetical protein [Chitinophaga agri]|uniref:Uncharacterized protein n=1 Tax=Chitinophaga agri TaxID=2703787 RepID=A0A6B9ZBV2_9BACT|nr:hypothetical protein [Chitinophaga agri]QHS58073.1 hypothetical protein GWR21_00240 [Chitinophaga agri]
MPKMYLEILKENLLSRWKQAFIEFHLLEEFKNNITSEKYVPGVRYNLDDYGTPAFLQPEEKVFPVGRVRELGDFHFYGFTADGLPSYTSYAHSVNKQYWGGYYTYGKEWVEYIEYNLNTRIPSSIKRIQFDAHGRKIAYQSLIVNSRGSDASYEDMTNEEKIHTIIDNEHAMFCNLEHYEIVDGRIVRADCLSIVPGAGESKYENIYTYDESGELTEIRHVYETGLSQLAYVKPDTGLDVHVLIDTVAELMAAAIVDTLVEDGVEAPLALLELNYHCVDVYIPSLSPRSVAFTKKISDQHPDEDIFDLIFLATELDHPFLDINREQFERPFTQLMTIIRREEKWEMGTLMLRKVAHILTTTRLSGRIPVGEEFAAYAVDWSMEMEDFEDVLRECGATATAIASWKERGWL